MLWSILLLAIGFVLLVKGSEKMIDTASKLGSLLKIPSFIMGFTVIAFGTSCPELIVGIISGLHKTNQLTLGDVLGSAIANVALVIGVLALMAPLHIERPVVKKEIPLSIAIQVFLLILLQIGLVLSKVDGIILLIGFCIFMGYILTRSKSTIYVEEKNENEYDEVCNKKEPVVKLIVFLLMSIIVVVFGGNFVVSSSTDIARLLGINEMFIGLTIVAIGTSLPELITSVIAIKKNKSEIAVGNIIGSNIFNVLFVLGISAFIHPIKSPTGILLEFAFVFGATLILFILSNIVKTLRVGSGIILLTYYIVYILIKVFTGI